MSLPVTSGTVKVIVSNSPFFLFARVCMAGITGKIPARCSGVGQVFAGQGCLVTGLAVSVKTVYMDTFMIRLFMTGRAIRITVFNGIYDVSYSTFMAGAAVNRQAVGIHPAVPGMFPGQGKGVAFTAAGGRRLVQFRDVMVILRYPLVHPQGLPFHRPRTRLVTDYAVPHLPVPGNSDGGIGVGTFCAVTDVHTGPMRSAAVGYLSIKTVTLTALIGLGDVIVAEVTVIAGMGAAEGELFSVD